MAKCAQHVIIFGFFIYLTTLVAVNCANETKKDDQYNYYSVLNHQYQFYKRSVLKVINQSDPSDNFQGPDGTYDSLDFITKLKTNERNLVSYGDECSGICSSHSNLTQVSSYDATRQINTQYCPGRLHDCVFHEEPTSTRASYEINSLMNFLQWVWDADLLVFVQRRQVTLESICPTCKCLCDDYSNPNLTGSICLDPVLSNVADGYVVTGVRFKIVDKILRIQIQEGKLVDNIIEPDSHNWQELHKCQESKRMNYETRTLHMDDVILPEDFVVTGVSLNLTHISKGFYLSVYGKPMNEVKNLNINAIPFYSSQRIRTNVLTPDMEMPIVSQHPNVELSTPGQSSISFQPVSLKYIDEFDNTLLMPFIDIRDVTFNENGAFLRGVGIYWRGQKGFGGYIAFKLLVDKYPVKMDIVQQNSN